MKNNKLLLALRNGINTLTGRQKLIDQYNDITHKLTEKSDSMEDGAKKTELSEKIDKLIEMKWKSYGNAGKTYSEFDPYKANRKVLKQKIAEGQKLMKQVGISR